MSAEGIASPDGLPVVHARGRAGWRLWLENNHETQRGAWLVFAKKGSSLASVTYDEAVEEALAFGWIDSRSNKADDARYLQLFTKRKPRSAWAATNRERVARLIADGRMTPAGMAAVEAAKRNGT